MKNGKIILYNTEIVRLGEIRNFIDQNFDKSLTLETLSEKFSVSIPTLRRHYYFIYKESITHYIHERRMKQAMALVKEHSEPIGQIAITVGYNDRSAFTRAFKKFFGKSPFSIFRND